MFSTMIFYVARIHAWLCDFVKLLSSIFALCDQLAATLLLYPFMFYQEINDALG